MIGISFEIPNEYGNHLEKILHNICIDKYCWIIEYSEVLESKDNNLRNMFDEDIMDGKEFKEEVNTADYYMIFLTAIAFKNKEDIVEVKNYNDYINSNAELAVICVDSSYVDIFSKNEDILEEILKSCKNNNYENIGIITEENNKIFNFV